MDGVPAASVQSFDLKQNRPNPSNGRTIIEYSVPKVTRVRITVWDLQGRMVKLAEEGERQPGTYSVQMDVRGMAKGIYLYRMQAGAFTRTKKLIVD